MVTANIWDIFEYNGKLMKVMWINEWYKSIWFIPIIEDKYPHCWREESHEVIEQSLNFQEWAKPIKTIWHS